MKIKTRRIRSEAYHAEKDGKEFQVEVRLEDGTVNDPKKCTVIIDGEETTVDVKNGEDALKKAVKAGAEKLGFKIVEGYYDNGPTIADVRQYLQRTLDELDDFDDDAHVIMSPNTYGISNYFIALGSHGYMPMEGFDVDDEEDEEDESKKSEAVKKLQRKIKEARRKAARRC